MKPNFRQYIASLTDRYGTARAVAALIPMSESAFSRGVRNEGTLSEENLLRLAEAVGDNPLEVLRIAGKGAVADIIERQFGKPRAPLSATDRALLALPDDAKQQMLIFVRNLSRRAKE